MAENLWGDLIGLFAYDTGCVSSGIYDPVLKARCVAALKAMDEPTLRLFISRGARDEFLSEEALAQRYGLEDVKIFIDWLATLGIEP